MSIPLIEEFRPQGGIAKQKRQSRRRRNCERIKKLKKRVRANRRSKQFAGSTSDQFSDEWKKLTFPKRSRIDDVCDQIIRLAIKQGVFVNPGFKKLIELLKSENQKELSRLINRNIVYDMLSERVTYFGTIEVKLHTRTLMPVKDVLREKGLMGRLIAWRIFQQRRYILTLARHERSDYMSGCIMTLFLALGVVAFFLVVLQSRT